MSITREQARSLVEERVENANLRRHMLACEAIMRALAERFGEDADI
jgi:predicted hydrolase (HD superfamily)